jgi:periplasmic divalent cation tolerance protein
MTDLVLVLTTVPDDERGETMARALVDRRLAACVNLYPAMTSVYRWRGGVERASERQLLVKTSRDRVKDVQTLVADLHPYELPEFLVVPVSDGSAPYLAWVREESSAIDPAR